MSSHHQAKRPYAGSQPSITSYFPSTSPTSQPSYSITPSSLNDTRSSLPANVQANLLSVGMRVRKSVPEGYKTGSYSAFTLFSDVPPVQEVKSPQQRTGTRPRARELTPFCGVLNVGGMAQQQWGIYNSGSQEAFEDVGEADDEDDLPVLSQGSTVSNASMASFTGANKRRFEMEDECQDEEKAVFGLGGRAIAVPRRMKKGQGKVRVVGQENVGDVDFEDAEFLDYGLVGVADEEMGGV